MIFPEKSWEKYIRILSAIDKTAARKFTAFLDKTDISTQDGRKAAIDYAYALATKYGEMAAAGACEMYDAVAEASGVVLPAAVPAETATYGEVAKTVNGMAKQNQSNEAMGNGVGRLVKRAGADTTLKNAIRDGAEFAWVPHGDTCSFCLMLASNGWQKASKKTIKGDHAEHIHSNCDCTFAVRFDGKSKVGGYDPDKYREMYENAEGDTWEEKLNSMRRAEYSKNGEIIREQKRELYARNRKIKYGEINDIQTDKGIITARRVDRYGYNNIYVNEKVDITEKQLRNVNNQVSEAKRVVDVINDCDAKVVITDIDDPIASYNPRTNTILISKRMTSNEEIVKAQEFFTCPNDTRSTAVHEMFHWLDAYEYRKSIGEITDAGPMSQYSVMQREKAFSELKKAGVEIDDYEKLASISPYALKSALENDWEEVYTEYRTQMALEGGV